jgi:uncharacterized protein (UPF0248 family)
MKTFQTIFLVLVCANLIFVTSGFAVNPRETDKRFSEEKLKLIERNLVIGLESNMPSLQASAAIVLKQIKLNAPYYDFSETIIPLMRIVKDENNEVTTRIAAAVVLHDLCSARGDFAIKRTAQFTDVERMKRICSLLAYDRLKQAQSESQ